LTTSSQQKSKNITGVARRELDAALNLAKDIQRVKLEKEAATKAIDDKLATAISTAYDSLVAAGDTGIPVSTVMSTVADAIPNTSAFTIRMKSSLSAKGNPYILERKKVHGTPHYVLTPYNLPIEQS
jgi:hypothetical protein